MKALTIRLTAGELRDWARNLQWFYPPTMKLSTFITLRTEPVEFPAAINAVELLVNHVGIGHTVEPMIEPEVDDDRPKSISAYNGARSRMGYGPV